RAEKAGRLNPPQGSKIKRVLAVEITCWLRRTRVCTAHSVHVCRTRTARASSGRGSRTRATIAGMRVLVVGGSGYRAGLVLARLARRHSIRVLDRRPPQDAVDYLPGSATEYADLRRATGGVDAVVHCAMGNTAWDTPDGAVDAF